MKHDRASAAITALGEAGLRTTPVRLGVLDILAKSRQPLDVPHIVAKLPSHTDAVTVYRTLNTFTRKKLVHRIRGEDRSWRYALSQGEQEPRHQHPHFVCETCGKVECLADAQIPATFVPSLGVAQSYKIDYPEVILHGLCPRCHSLPT
jgi:Fur family ferric uptake transcriptional regulator